MIVDLKKEEEEGSYFGWLCPSCVQTEGAEGCALVGRAVKIWRTRERGGSHFLSGVINSKDKASGEFEQSANESNLCLI